MSKLRRQPPPDTVARQRRAADPAHSAWVSANAGAGKTHVLASRVVRLLLGGVDPATILCLTYTKAAAANMSNRVFATLADWAILSDADLATAIAELTGRPAPKADLAVARRLFARAVETPGGLKIQTIHGFCERALQLFPFEANVAGDFRVLDEFQAEALLAGAMDRVVAQADGDDGLAAALARVAREITDEGFKGLLREIAGKHRGWLRRVGRDAKARRRAMDEIAAAHGVPSGLTSAQVLADYFEPHWFANRFEDAALALEDGGPQDNKLAAGLRLAATLDDPRQRLEALAGVFLTKEREPRKETGFASQKCGSLHLEIRAHLVAEQQRLIATRARLLAADLIERAEALCRIAGGVFAAYERAKAARGVLDFADLVEKTLAMLRRTDAAWVLHKLDRGVSHVLIDEAQDTSPQQWGIVDRLVAELTAGEGQHERRRTLFVVGDEKQSIFGFQGAAPQGFSEWREEFRTRHERAGIAFAPETLTLSFRSTDDVLSAVDRTFETPGAYEGLVFGSAKGPEPHQSLDPRRPGFVDLWPVTKADEEPVVDDAIGSPVDAPEPGSAALRLAERVAAAVRHLVDHGDPTGRAVRPGDVMILVRRRSAFFEAVIRALKQQGLPVAGADRLVLAAHIAVMDLVALGHAVLLEADDFSLAAVLKSPLCGLDDDELMAIAPGRAGSLWQAVQAAAATSTRIVGVAGQLRRWRRAAAGQGPFGFYASVLEADGGRRAMLARLGPDAADAIDAFLDRALAHERDATPTLADFLAAFEAVSGEIKRDLDQASDEVRVMTVHAAKGLEAPIVILPDTTTLPSESNASRLVEVAGASGPVLVWSPRKETDTAPVAAAKRLRREADLCEYRRLLYVAMTRAENGLIVCGHARRSNIKDDAKLIEPGSWCDLVATGLARTDGSIAGKIETLPAFDGDGDIFRWRAPRALDPVAPADVLVAAPAEPEPPWLRRAARAEPPDPPPLKPSQALDAADRRDRPPEPGAARVSDVARQRGILAHRLLEALAGIDAGRRREEGAKLTLRHGGLLTEPERAAALADTLRVLADPALAALFAPGSVAEIPVSGEVRLPDGREIAIAGRIDRMVATADRIVIADFKTAATPKDPADIPAASIVQLALYRRLLAEIAAPRPVSCLVVYTAGPAAFELPEARLEAALASVAAA